MTQAGAGAFVAAWTAWPPGVAATLLVTIPYLLWWRRAAQRGASWPWWRPVLYLVLGVGTLAYAVCGPLQVLRGEILWVAALQAGLLSCVTPVGLALGAPLRLRALAGGGATAAPRRRVLGYAARVLMFPAVSSILAVCSITAVFFTPYLAASLRSPVVEAVLVVHLVGTGLLFVLPLLMSELLPAWASPGVRALLAFGDGLLDAVPGVALLSTNALIFASFPGFTGPGAPVDLLYEQHLAGGVLLAVSEVVGLPVLAAVLLEWVHSDDREAAEADAVLDARRDNDQPEQGLWWKSDPRLADRFRPPNGPGGG